MKSRNFLPEVFMTILLIGCSQFVFAEPRSLIPDAVKIFSIASPSVLTVKSTNGSSAKQGSAVAFHYSTDDKHKQNGTWLATNLHVVANQTTVKVIQDNHEFSASVEYEDQKADIAILYVKDLVSSYIPPIGSGELQIGARVYAIGSPLGLERSLSDGLVSGIRKGDGINFIQTTAAISPGSSGGALLDGEGRFVAITTFKLQNGESLNFAIDSERIKQIKDAINAAKIFQAVYTRKVVLVDSEEDKDNQYIESTSLIRWMLETKRPDGTATYSWFLNKIKNSIETKNKFWGGNPEFDSLQAEFLSTRPRIVNQANVESQRKLTRISCAMHSSLDDSFQFDLTIVFDEAAGTVNGRPARITSDDISFATGKDGAFTAKINRFSMRANIGNESKSNILNGTCVRLQNRSF